MDNRVFALSNGGLALGTVAPLAAEEYPRIQVPPGFEIDEAVVRLEWHDRVLYVTHRTTEDRAGSDGPGAGAGPHGDALTRLPRYLGTAQKGFIH